MTTQQFPVATGPASSNGSGRLLGPAVLASPKVRPVSGARYSRSSGFAGGWAWGQRALTQINELENLSRIAQRRPDAASDADVMAERARSYLDEASHALRA